MKRIKKKGIRHKGQFNKKLVAVTAIICLICCTLSAGLFAQPVIVYAASGTSIKSLIVTLIAALGIGNANPTFTNTLDQSTMLNSSYESLIDGTYSASDLDSELSNLGVNVTRMTNTLANTSDEASQVLANVQEGSLPSDLGAASAGENIQAVAEHLQETGEVSTAIGGQAVGVLNGLGALYPIVQNVMTHNQGVQKLQDLICAGTDYNYASTAQLNEVPVGGFLISFTLTNGRYGFIYAPPGTEGYFSPPQPGSLGDRIGCRKIVDMEVPATASYKIYSSNGKLYESDSIKTNGGSWIYGSFSNYNNVTVFSSYNSYVSYFSNLRQNGYNPTKSPDLIGEEGNQQGTITEQNGVKVYNFPDIKPVINITNNMPTEYITPIDYDDYKNWQQTANQNTQNGETGQEQGEDLADLIRDFIRQWDGTVPVPTEAPVPTLSPVNPIVTPVPSIPVTPTPSPEEDAEIPKGFTTPELKDKFPFCIPYDIYTAFGLLTAKGEAPVFDWSLTFGPYGTYNVHIDLSPWDPAARLLRILQLLLFIVCLAVGTRKLGGFGSGEE